jgi:transcriptional regulator with XRE-family HTH domain
MCSAGLGEHTSGKVTMDADNDAVTLSDAPAVARRRVRLALRSARSAKQLTQSEVANAMGWSLSKVMRIEKGQVNISKGDLRMVLDYLDVTNPEEVEQLELDASVSRKERYVTDADDRENLTPAMLRLTQYEAEANAVLYYSDVVLPGQLQTEDYARAILERHRHRIDETKMNARLQARMRRRKALLERARPLEYRLILDEAVLRRPTGGREIMRAQLLDLLRTIQSGVAQVRVAPFTSDSPLVFLGPFTIIDLGDRDKLLYRETVMGDEIVETRDLVDLHDEVFEDLWPNILDESASSHLIEAAARGDLWGHDYT